MSILDQIAAVGVVLTTRRIDLGDCDEAYTGAVFDVWVTPTRAHWAEWVGYQTWLAEVTEDGQAQRDAEPDKGRREALDAELIAQLEREAFPRLDAWLGETWTNIPAEDVPAIRTQLQEVHPAAWAWLLDHTVGAIYKHREELTKNSRGG